MKWLVETTPEFVSWLDLLSQTQHDDVLHSLNLLADYGPQLGYPHSSSIKGARHRHMRELRVQSRGRPLRILYAFDSRRAAIMLVGGDKTGDDRFYETHVPLADKLYDRHLRDLD